MKKVGLVRLRGVCGVVFHGEVANRGSELLPEKIRLLTSRGPDCRCDRLVGFTVEIDS